MPDLPKDPLEQLRTTEQNYLGLYYIRSCVTFLSVVLLGFVLIPFSFYFVISFLDVDVTEFETSSSTYFIVSHCDFDVIGLITTFNP